MADTPNRELEECPICNYVAKYFGLPIDADEKTPVNTDLGDLANLVHMYIEESAKF